MNLSNLHIIATSFLLILISVWGSSSIAYAQLNTSETIQKNTPRLIKFSARSGAMGDATIADPTDISIININPAGLSFVDDRKVVQLNISQNWENNLVLENITFPALRIKNHTLGAQFAIHHNQGLEALNLLGHASQLSPKLSMNQLDIAYAYSFMDKISIGILNSISFAYNSLYQVWTYNPTFGLLYMPSESMSYALAFRGLGDTPSYLVHNASMTSLASYDLRESLEFGISLALPVYSSSGNKSVTLAVSNEKQFGIDGSWYKMGVELTSIPYLAFRSGILYQSNQEILAPRFGLGILTDIVALDYTISHSKDLYERYHQLGLTIHL